MSPRLECVVDMKSNDEVYAQTLVCGAAINNTGCSLKTLLDQRPFLRAVPESLIKAVETTARKRTGGKRSGAWQQRSASCHQS